MEIDDIKVIFGWNQRWLVLKDPSYFFIALRNKKSLDRYIESVLTKIVIKNDEALLAQCKHD